MEGRQEEEERIKQRDRTDDFIEGIFFLILIFFLASRVTCFFLEVQDIDRTAQTWKFSSKSSFTNNNLLFLREKQRKRD